MDCNCQGDKKSSTDSFFGVEHFEKYLEKIKQQRASNSISTDETKFSNLCPIDNLSINSMNSDNLKINNEKQQQPDDTCASEFRASEITLTPRNEASDSVKQFIKFKQNIQNTLMNFNDEMSSALRNSIGDINQICSKVRSCLSEMEQFDPKCPKREVVSTPDLSVGTPTRASAPDITLDSLKTPIITQSENQIRVVLSNVLPEETPQVENTTNGPVQNRPQSEEARTPTEKEGKLVLKEIISMHEEIKQCLDTMKEEVDKISEAHRLEYEQHMERIMQEVEAKKRESKKDDKEAKKKAVVEKVQKRIKEQEIRQRQFDDMKSQQSHTLSIPPGLESSVTRSRGLFDIHAKLVNQMHACDSLCEFERKMLKNPELRKQRKLKKARENREKALAKREREKERDKNPHLKYKDSLWFSNMHGKKNKQKKRYKDRMALHKTTSQTSDRSKNSVQSHDSTKSVCSTTCHCSTHCSCKVIVERSRPTTPRYNEKSRTGWMAFQSYNHLHSNKKLNCVDILDELTEKDVEPIRSEYPRKDDVIIDKHEFVENTFLYNMVYGKGNQKMLELLSTAVPPRIQCSASKCIKCQQKMKHYSDEKKPKKGHKKEVKKDRPPLPKKDDIAAKLRPYIFDPHLRYRTTITVMPVTVYVDRSPLIESKKPPINLVETGSNTSSSSASYLYTAGDFSRKPPIDMQVRTRQINERKLWTNKYGKTVGQHLVSFIEKQPALSDEVKKCKTIEEKRTEDRPKNGKTKDVEANQRQPKMNLIKPTKTMMARAPSKMSSQETCEMKQPKKRGPPSPRTIAKKAENSYNMLDNMRNLVKNHSVMFESNIQNIIEMIEKKIVDVLSKPEKQNAEAFNAVEKEIRQVLKKMRMLHGKSKKEKVDSLKMTALDTIFGYDPESPVSEEGEENVPKVDLDGVTREGTSPMLEERVSDGSQVSPGLEEQASDASQSPRAVELGSNLTSDSERCVVTAACGPDSSSKEEPVKEPRKLEINEEEVKSDASEILCLPEAEPVPQYEYDVKSYNNILEFLEQITARPKEAQAQVVCHLTRNAEVQYEPIVLHQSFVQCSVEYTNVNATTSTQTKRDTVKKVKISRELPKVAMMEYGSDIEKEHKHILNAVYTTVFLVMYLALSFKFGCSSA